MFTSFQYFLDYLTVSETAKEPPQSEEGEPNSPQKLSLEATYINQNLAQQMIQVRDLACRSYTRNGGVYSFGLLYSYLFVCVINVGRETIQSP